MAAEHGVPIAVGNTNFEIGVHVAAALPDVIWLEYSFLSYNHLLETPIEFSDGTRSSPIGRATVCVSPKRPAASWRGRRSDQQARHRLGPLGKSDER